MFIENYNAYTYVRWGLLNIEQFWHKKFNRIKAIFPGNLGHALGSIGKTSMSLVLWWWIHHFQTLKCKRNWVMNIVFVIGNSWKLDFRPKKNYHSILQYVLNNTHTYTRTTLVRILHKLWIRWIYEAFDIGWHGAINICWIVACKYDGFKKVMFHGQVKMVYARHMLFMSILQHLFFWIKIWKGEFSQSCFLLSQGMQNISCCYIVGVWLSWSRRKLLTYCS
jgi:hypothetical protein